MFKCVFSVFRDLWIMFGIFLFLAAFCGFNGYFCLSEIENLGLSPEGAGRAQSMAFLMFSLADDFLAPIIGSIELAIEEYIKDKKNN